MSLLQKAKELAQQRELEKIEEEKRKLEADELLKQIDLEKTESENEEEGDEEVLEIPIIDNEFNFYKKRWVLAPHMEEILDGNLGLIPLECLLTHYILRWGNLCFYVVLENPESGDEFDIYEFEWVGDDVGEKRDIHGEEVEIEPDFKLYESSAKSKEIAHFLAKKISEGFQIFIEERKEFEPEFQSEVPREEPERNIMDELD